MNFNNQYMRNALENALNAASIGEVPVGAVIVKRSTGDVISTGYNMVETEENPIKHAEIIAIESACKITKSKNLSGYDLYVTLEPCAMCSAAISYARIDRLFYGAADAKQGAVENGIRFFTQLTCMHRPEIYNEILADETGNILKSFFRNLRG